MSGLLFVCLLLHYSETFNLDLPSPAPQSLLRTVNAVGRYFKVLVLIGPATALPWGRVAQIPHVH